MKFILGIIVAGVVAIGSFIVVFDRIAAHKKEIALKQEEAQKLVVAEQVRQAELRKLEIQKEAEKARLLAKQEAEKKILLAEKEKQTEEERIRTHPARLTLAEKEVADANSIYTPLFEKAAEMKKKVAVLQGQYETLDIIAKGLEKQIGLAKDTKDRAEGQYRTVNRATGTGTRLNQTERETSAQKARGLTTKATAAREEADRKKVVLDFTKDELKETQNKLVESETILQTKRDVLEAIKREKI
jgi:hypothetical protein